MSSNNEDLLKNNLDTMTKVIESERLYIEAKENTKAIIERKDALEKELKGAKKALREKIAKLTAHVKVDNDQLHAAYYHGQTDCISSMWPKVQKNLQVYFTKRWITTLNKLQVEATSSLRDANGIPYPVNLIITPNLKIQVIMNDDPLVREVENQIANPLVEGMVKNPNPNLTPENVA